MIETEQTANSEPGAATAAERPRRGFSSPRRWQDVRAAVDPPWGIVAGLVALNALRPLRHVWIVGAIEVVLLFIVPGISALRALRVPAGAISRVPIYIPAASMVVVMISALAADLLGHHLGISQPLHGAYSLVAVDVISILCVLSLFVRRGERALAQRVRWPQLSPARLLPFVLPLCAAAGALALNNGHGPVLARVAELLIALTIAGLLLLHSRVSVGTTALLVWCCALAAEWAFSLRSDSVLGFDISTEYHVAQSIQHVGYWHANQHGNAYSAMLSITLLPSVLSSVAGVSTLVSFKVLFPVFTAFIPVATYYLANRFVSRGIAVASAALILGQIYFFEEMPQLARQELALFLFAALCVALLDENLPRRSRQLLVVLLSFGLVVSHYSSAYVAILIVACAFVLQLLSLPLPWQRKLTPYLLTAVLALAGGAALWYEAVTHSASNVNEFTSNLAQNGLDLFPNSGNASSLLSTYLSGNVVTAVPATRYEPLVGSYVQKHEKYIHPVPDATQAKYALRPAVAPAPPLRSKALSRLTNDAITVIGQLMLVLGGLGALLMWLLPSASPVERLCGLLATGTIPTLALLRFSGTAAQAYNQQRALLQGLILLAIPAGWLAARVLRRLRHIAWTRWFEPLLRTVGVAALVLLFVYNSGLASLGLGGGHSVNIGSSGEDFERLFVTAPELASAEWVSVQAGRRALVFADRYGQLRLFQASGRLAFQNLTPVSIDHYGWVYASRTNVVLSRARGEINGLSATFVFPGRFLRQNFSLVYNDGQSEVFH